MLSAKTCASCDEYKTLDNFPRRKASLDGTYRLCKVCAAKDSKKYYTYHRTDKCKYQEKYTLSHKAEKAKYYQSHKSEATQRAREYYQNHKDVVNEKRQKRKEADLLFRMSIHLRNRLGSALKVNSWRKTSKFNDYIGCSLEELKIHIESQFKSGMTWTNYSVNGWHLDHIVPLASAVTVEELYSLCHYTNLQPLWSNENWSKGGKYVIC